MGNILVYYVSACAEKTQAYYAMKREIARKRGNFRGVCPVSNECSARNRAAETYLTHAYIAWRGINRLTSRFYFSDTI